MLLVIGLLVSGVLVGKDMIRAAELRSITTQKDQLQTSVMLFQDKYQGLPGDLKNATAFWGTMTGGTCSLSGTGATTATGTQTCNGSGDGVIRWNDIIGVNSEIHLFWQHLSNAGLVAGKYTGVWDGIWGGGQEMAGRIKNTVWHAPYYGRTVISDTYLFEGDYGNILRIYNTTQEPATPAEAWGIDKKIDDGLPGIGKMVTIENNGVNCNTSPTSATMPASSFEYNLAYESPACSIIFKNMW